MFSKAQWDKEGEMAYETKPAGTGPYSFKERQLDRYVLYERTPTPHWKWGVVDWKEIKMTWTREEPIAGTKTTEREVSVRKGTVVLRVTSNAGPLNKNPPCNLAQLTELAKLITPRLP